MPDDLRPRLGICLVFAAAAFASLVVPAPATAGGAVLTEIGGVNPDLLDVRVAVAVTPAGTTRWSSIAVSNSSPAMWLVPARPGAAVDWAADTWLTALEEATAVRVVPPSAVSVCPFPRSPQRTPSYAIAGTKRQPSGVVVHTSADDARAYALEHGYDVSPDVGARIDALYASGWNLVATEVQSSWGSTSPGTLRVSDDGGPALPLALTSSRSVDIRVTAFTIAPGVAALPGNRDIAANEVWWGPSGPTYVEWRDAVIERGAGTTWLRESSSHAALFDGTAVLGGPAATSVAKRYFGAASAEDQVSCTAAARSAGASSGIVGTACAAGATARVPGGTPCVPSAGDMDPSALSCGDGVDDLALALSGTSPAAAVITRWSGVVPKNALGANVRITFDAGAAQRIPVIVAGGYLSCNQSEPLVPPFEAAEPPPGATGSAGSGTKTRYVTETGGCGGSATSSSTVVYDEEETMTETTEDCSGSTTTSGGDGWDDGDDDWDDDDWDDDGWDTDDSSEGCGADDSSSSSDSCSGGSSSSSSGGSDGWDMPDEASPEGKKTLGKTKVKVKRNKSSPVSRYALLAVLLLLPLRRRARNRARS